MKTTAKFLSLLVGATLAAHSAHATDAVKTKDFIVKQIEVEGRVSFSNILFKLDSTEFADENSRRQVNEIAKALLDGPFAKASFTLVGHTCDLGDIDHNQKLSERRAMAVGKHLAKMGVAPDRLESAGLGETKPEVPNSSEENRARNRRVVLVLKKP